MPNLVEIGLAVLKKSRNQCKMFMGYWTDGRTDKEIDGQTKRWTDRQRDGWTDKEMDVRLILIRKIT